MKRITTISCQSVDHRRLKLFILSLCCLCNLRQSCFVKAVVLFLMCVKLFCDQIEPKSLTLGEVLDGDRMALSLYELHFGGVRTICHMIMLRRCLLLNVCEFKQYTLSKITADFKEYFDELI